MYRKILKLLIVFSLSISLYGFSRPANEEDELRKHWIRLGTHELVLDNIPVTDYLVLMLKTNTNIRYQQGDPDYLSYKDAVGEGGQFTFYFRTRGGGRTCLNFIWIKPFDRNVLPGNTILFDHFLGFIPLQEDGIPIIGT